MPDEDEPTKPRNWVSFVLVLFLALTLLYLASVGPVVWLWHKTYGFGGNVSSKAIHAFYAPGIWLYEKSILRRPIHMYLGAWGIK